MEGKFKIRDEKEAKIILQNFFHLKLQPPKQVFNII